LSFAFFAGSLAQADLRLTAVIDGPLPGGLPKAIELVACSEIPDLGLYGLELVSNGGGTSGEEIQFSGSASAGDFIYVASENVGFEEFFGFVPTFVSSSANINGDDAIVLYKNDAIIDVFGETNVDGTGQPWEYLDGWAARVNQAAPSGDFDWTGWTFSGPNALDGETTNAASATPVPVKQYKCKDSEGPPVTNSIMDIQGR
jgi:hypothetical protein